MARLSGRYAEITMLIAPGTAIVVPMASYTVNMESEFIDATNFGDTQQGGNSRAAQPGRRFLRVL